MIYTLFPQITLLNLLYRMWPKKLNVMTRKPERTRALVTWHSITWSGQDARTGQG